MLLTEQRFTIETILALFNYRGNLFDFYYTIEKFPLESSPNWHSSLKQYALCRLILRHHQAQNEFVSLYEPQYFLNAVSGFDLKGIAKALSQTHAETRNVGTTNRYFICASPIELDYFAPQLGAFVSHISDLGLASAVRDHLDLGRDSEVYHLPYSDVASATGRAIITSDDQPLGTVRQIL